MQALLDTRIYRLNKKLGEHPQYELKQQHLCKSMLAPTHCHQVEPSQEQELEPMPVLQTHSTDGDWWWK
jgi:hypothetical protein